MANIQVRKEETRPMMQTREAFDPFREVRNLLRWDPWRDLRMTAPVETAWATFAPAFDVKETKDAYIFKADVPGLREQDLEVAYTGDLLTVKGTREAEHQEQTDTYYTYERTYGTFNRSFTLPTGADAEHAHADMRDGVLTVIVPKRPEVQAKKIAIKNTDKAKA